MSSFEVVIFFDTEKMDFDLGCNDSDAKPFEIAAVLRYCADWLDKGDYDEVMTGKETIQ